MDTKSPSPELNRLTASVLKALAHPIRLQIVEVLREGERCVCEIVDSIEGQRSNISRHIGILMRAGLIEGRREGLRIFYRLKMPCVLSFFDCTHKVLIQQLRERARMLEEL
ncbi:MAG: hypothetical protein AMJ92_08095 [candidate division Zixibacteria bacterium SM23_81]|nr:MAG: hypothetical protein AMJ92_08095 [candidate division Zixibacteria bacterium SM23_81]